MLEVTTLHGISRAVVAQGMTVIIRDEHQNLLAIVMQSADGVTNIYSYHDPVEFEKVAKTLGIDRIAVCDKLHLSEPIGTQGTRLIL